MTNPKTAAAHNSPLKGRVEPEVLKPCPFCGSNDVDLVDVSETHEHQGYVVCRNNACGAWPHNVEEIEAVINQWNSRPIEEAQRARIAALESAFSAAEGRLDGAVYALGNAADGLHEAAQYLDGHIQHDTFLAEEITRNEIKKLRPAESEVKNG